MSLRDRLRASAQGREQRGGGKAQLLDLSRAGRVVNLSEVKEGREVNRWDILPWKITQPWYEKLRGFNGKTMGELGRTVSKEDYKLEIPRHKVNIGNTFLMVICHREAFSGKCAVCDDMFEMYKEAKEASPERRAVIKENAKKLQPSWRVFYNIFDYNQEADPQVISVVEVSYHHLEIRLLELMETGSEDYWDAFELDRGKTLIFTGRNKPIGKNTNIEPEGLRFEARQAWSEADVYDPQNGVYALDAMVPMLTSEEITRTYLELNDDIPEPGSGSVGNMPEREISSTRRMASPAQTTTEQAASIRRTASPTTVEPTVQETAQPVRRRAPAPDQGVKVVIECPVGHFGEPGGWNECNDCIQVAYDACIADQDKKRAEAEAAVTELPKTEAPARRESPAQTAQPAQTAAPVASGGFARKRTNR
uniref:Bacteriophage T4 Gp32 single-stranded DNA-binding domain-containing protein n=1 Tax=viral metagenome TaxID=1070528 RepID=A0A6M3IKP7_9ZZZZ